MTTKRIEIPRSAINCNKCFCPLARNEIIEVDIYTIRLKKEKEIALTKINDESNTIYCKMCGYIISTYSAEKKIYTIQRKHVHKVKYPRK